MQEYRRWENMNDSRKTFLWENYGNDRCLEYLCLDLDRSKCELSIVTW